MPFVSKMSDAGGVKALSRYNDMNATSLGPVAFTVNVLAVGGGGSGSQGQDGIYWGSGGGGGGVSDGTIGIAYTGPSYSVTVGAGGAYATAQSNTSGAASTVNGTITAGGGNRGFQGGTPPSGYGGTGTTGNGGAGGLSNGNTGAAGPIATLDSVQYGGGGGAPGAGGPTGGAGGGGAGGVSPNGVGQPGTNGLGGGGGGGDVYGNRAGGNGGSGLVKLRYPDARTITIGAGLTGTTGSPSGGFKTTTITAGTGNVSWA